MKGETVAWAGLYKVRLGGARLDFLPFLVIYVALVAGVFAPLSPEKAGEDQSSSTSSSTTSTTSLSTDSGVAPLWVLIVWPLVLLAHLLTHLSTHWSVACDATVSYARVSTAREATHVRVRPPPNSGSEEMVPLLRVDDERVSAENSSITSITVVGQEHRLPFARFSFQKTHFCYWDRMATAHEFTRLSYPTTGLVHHFLQRQGYAEEGEVKLATRLWGENVFDIPLPPFRDLFKEHAVAPFFVFQVLCVLLWSLDEYWYYSLFTLVLLVVFESTVCYQRQRSLEMLRSMRRPPYRVWCYRGERWRLLSSEDLLPGDLISLGRMNAHPSSGADAEEEEEEAGRGPKRRAAAGGGSLAKFKGRGGGARRRAGYQPPPPPPPEQEEATPSERLVPCDLLLLSGTCIVNEAMLTGESTPQLKEFLEIENSRWSSCSNGSSGKSGRNRKKKGKGKVEEEVEEEEEQEYGLAPSPLFSLGPGVSVDAEVRSHVVFGGTKILQLGGTKQATNSSRSGGSSSSGSVPAPPDKGGAVAFVLRTGFETSQGQLMRTIIFATRRVTAGSAETAVFIGILLLFAVVASGIVLLEGLKDESRNRFKLLLHCIMIITSVVPPELPMELSLAVTNSLAALTKSLVYCTEPFRIPYAGKVTVCCFDKTGTLTSDDLVLRGVVPLVSDSSGKEGELEGGKDGSIIVNGGTSGNGGKKKVVEETILSPDQVAGPALWVLVACHSLMTVEGRVAGDPMECAAVDGLGWMVASNGDAVMPNPTSTSTRQQQQQQKQQQQGKAERGEMNEDLAPIRLHHRYPFNSTLRRMSVLASRSLPSASPHSSSHQQQLLILTKGAPEAIRPLLSTVPPHYTSTYLYHMGRGRRVLALAYRILPPETQYETVRHFSREDVEEKLHLAGLLIVDCPLKKDTGGVIKALRESRHRTVMITGDSALTAAEVARQIRMVPHGPERTLQLVRRRMSGGKEGKKGRRGEMGWEPMANMVEEVVKHEGDGKGREGARFIPFRAEEMRSLAEKFSLCVGGEALADLVEREARSFSSSSHTSAALFTAEKEGLDSSINGATTTSSNSRAGSMSRETLRWLSKICPHVVVFARVAPDQKEMLIASLNEAGDVTLMCGDGTNDVGALKQAHVGVSIINSPELEKRTEATSAKYEFKLAAMGAGKKGNASRAQVQAAAGLSGGGSSEEEISQMAQILAELREQEKDPAIVQLGDASIASPFTAKRTSVECVLAVVRQGRCTLVTTLQVYKILALNCLVSAYMLSSLYLFGVKQGDLQMTALGLAVAALFFFVSRAEPLERLSAERPPARIFCAQVCVSIALQFLVHLGCLVNTLERAKPLMKLTSKDPSIAPDGPFRPNLVNTAIFLLSAVTQVNTFTANYRGHPFMQSLGENKMLGRFTVGLYAVLMMLALEIVPIFNHWLQLVHLPGPFRRHLVTVLLLDTGAVLTIEQLCLRFLPA